MKIQKLQFPIFLNKKLLIILAVAAILRLYNLTSTPPSLYWDEVSIGYNAYSISQTGKDEWGKPLPYSFQSFGEYKLPGQIYLTVPFTWLLGLNDFSVRLPSAIMGITAVAGIYFLAKTLAQKITPTKSQSIATFSALLLAVLPWHLQFSRASFEANSAITLLIYALLFLFAAQKTPYKLLLSAVFFSISFYFYHHTRIIAPLILAFYFTQNFKFFLANIKITATALVLGLILSLPIIISLFQPTELSRVSQVSIIDLQTPQTNPDFVSAFARYQSLPIPANIKDKLAWSDVLFKYYLRHLDINFLFVHGDSQTRHRTPSTGLLYYFQIPLLLIASIYLLKKRSKESIFILFLCIIFPISAIFSDLTPHALRSSTGVIGTSLLSAFAVIFIQKLPQLLKLFSIIIVTVSVFFYLFQYHIQSPIIDSQAWGYGHKELFHYLQNHANNQPVIISGRYWNPYIYYLYYNQIPPEKYQNTFEKKSRIDNYYFAGAGWDDRPIISNEIILKEVGSSQTAIIVTTPPEDSSITLNKHLLHTVNDLQNQPIFLIYELEI